MLPEQHFDSMFVCLSYEVLPEHHGRAELHLALKQHANGPTVYTPGFWVSRGV